MKGQTSFRKLYLKGNSYNAALKSSRIFLLRRKLYFGIIFNINFLRENKESPAYICVVSAKHPLHL